MHVGRPADPPNGVAATESKTVYMFYPAYSYDDLEDYDYYPPLHYGNTQDIILQEPDGSTSCITHVTVFKYLGVHIHYEDEAEY